MYCLSFYLSKNRYQGIYTVGLMHGGAYMRGAYTRSKTSVSLGKGELTWGNICGGGGGKRNTVCGPVPL